MECEEGGLADCSERTALDCREACTFVAEFLARWPESSWATGQRSEIASKADEPGGQSSAVGRITRGRLTLRLELVEELHQLAQDALCFRDGAVAEAGLRGDHPTAQSR